MGSRMQGQVSLCGALVVSLSVTMVSQAGTGCDGWLEVGAGVSNLVWSLAEHNGDVIVAGEFTTAGGDPALRIARWDGQDWHTIGGGTNNIVVALHVWNGDLIAGGLFTQAGGQTVNHIARWTGTDWEAIGGGMNGWVLGLGEYNGDLIAVGDFTEAGGTAAARIARWDGAAWHALGAGIDGGWVWDVSTYNGELIVIGGITGAGGAPASGIARWNGTTWQALGDGLTVPNNQDGPFNLLVWNGDLIATGLFTEAGAQSTAGIARWDGSDWHLLPGLHVGSTVKTAIEVDGGLLVGGMLVDPQITWQVMTARWNGSNWTPVLGGPWGQMSLAGVYAMLMHDDDVIVAGRFDEAGGDPIDNITLLCKCFCGACCVEGTCAEVPEQWCNEFGGTYHGDNARCVNVASCTPAPPSCSADLDGNTVVNVFDLLELLAQWGPCP